METESVEATGKTVEEALELALKGLDAARDEVEVEVLARAKSGFLGFGSQDARVRATRLGVKGTQVRTAKGIVDRLLVLMGISATSTIGKPSPDSPDTHTIEVEGDDSGLLIGRRGETLRAFQFVLNLMLARQATEGQGRVVLDVERYKERRARTLRDLALRAADRVSSSGRSITLEPMPANERRTIHVSLAGHPRVTTESTGDGDGRQVTIMPRRGGGSGGPPRGRGRTPS